MVDVCLNKQGFVIFKTPYLIWFTQQAPTQSSTVLALNTALTPAFVSYEYQGSSTLPVRWIILVFPKLRLHYISPIGFVVARCIVIGEFISLGEREVP
ncbi:hypothetical protein SBV1_280011 [Verrucomicrobia bacterium]|nr:hypothetical protein SBV1_280011 [Verrucomicrobiota bacterium]